MLVENINPERAIVSAVKANNYNMVELIPVMRKSLDLIGGLDSVVKTGNQVFVKINHLSPPSAAERGIVTHPIFVEAVVILLKEAGAKVTVGDDIEEGDEDGFKISGFREMCDRQGVALINLREAGFVEKECNGKILKKLYVSKIALESDVIVNLPKFKTHSLTTFTGGVKNMYGVIPAGLRRRFHGDYIRPDDFGQALVDIYSIAQPQLTIIDGIIAMEGEGPAAGKLKKLDLILASKDTVALDTIANYIIGLKAEDVPTTRYAGERGFGINDLKKIEILGEKIEAIVAPDFKLPARVSRAAMKRVPPGLVKYVLGQVSPRPRVYKKNCTACKKCVKICPTGAATMIGETADVNKKLCIRCMCCHEVCRFNAIVLYRPFTGKIIYGLLRAIRQM